MFLEEALLALAHPPVSQIVQQHLGRTDAANALPLGVRIWVDAAWNGVDVDEELQLDHRSELARLFPNVVHDLDRSRSTQVG